MIMVLELSDGLREFINLCLAILLFLSEFGLEELDLLGDQLLQVKDLLLFLV